MRSAVPATDDPVLVKRARVARLVSLAMRAGAALYVVATIVFFWALFTRFTPALASTMTACLVVGSLILAPAMVMKYAVKAANRADRDGDW